MGNPYQPSADQLMLYTTYNSRHYHAEGFLNLHFINKCLGNYLNSGQNAFENENKREQIA